jgi:zinc transporter ZupT
VLAILGVIVGIINVTAEGTRGFLLASIALNLSATALNTVPVLGTVFKYVLPFVVALVAGATIVVALRELFQTARKYSSQPTQNAKAGSKLLPAFIAPDLTSFGWHASRFANNRSD